MKTHKITSCLYKDKQGKQQRGIYMLNRRTNTAVLLDKNFNHIKLADTSIVTLESSEGCIYFDLSRH